MDWAMSGEDANGEPAREVSIHSLGLDETYQFWGPDDQFVIDQHPRVRSRLIAAAFRGRSFVCFSPMSVLDDNRCWSTGLCTAA